MEPNVEFSLLLGYYGGLLTERQRALAVKYAWEDLSLQEIAEQENISRQGVLDSLQRAKRQMQAYEQELGLLAREKKMKQWISLLEKVAGRTDLSPEAKAELVACIDDVKRTIEDLP